MSNPPHAHFPEVQTHRTGFRRGEFQVSPTHFPGAKLSFCSWHLSQRGKSPSSGIPPHFIFDHQPDAGMEALRLAPGARKNPGLPVVADQRSNPHLRRRGAQTCCGERGFLNAQARRLSKPGGLPAGTLTQIPPFLATLDEE